MTKPRAIQLSATFVRQFKHLPEGAREQVRQALDALARNPLRRRPGADIRRLRHARPTKHRIRVGGYRMIYQVKDDGSVWVVEVFARGRGYRV